MRLIRQFRKYMVKKGQTMKTIIGTDAAKLTGLQINLLQKVQQGHVTLDHLEWFIGLTKDEHDKLVASKPTVTVHVDLSSVCGSRRHHVPR